MGDCRSEKVVISGVASLCSVGAKVPAVGNESYRRAVAGCLSPDHSRTGQRRNFGSLVLVHLKRICVALTRTCMEAGRPRGTTRIVARLEGETLVSKRRDTLGMATTSISVSFVLRRNTHRLKYRLGH